jgi:hypothetical protein
LNSVGVVHRQHSHGRASDGRQADDPKRVARKVLDPGLLSRVEKRRHDSGVWIDARKIRALVKIAMLTGKGEIILPLRSAMLQRDDVLDVKRKSIVVGMKLAILAAVVGANGNSFAIRITHERIRRAFAWPWP